MFPGLVFRDQGMFLLLYGRMPPSGYILDRFDDDIVNKCLDVVVQYEIDTVRFQVSHSCFSLPACGDAFLFPGGVERLEIRRKRAILEMGGVAQFDASDQRPLCDGRPFVIWDSPNATMN